MQLTLRLSFLLVLMPFWLFAQRVSFQKWKGKNLSTTSISTDTPNITVGQDALIWKQPSGNFLLYCSINDSVQQKISYQLIQFDPITVSYSLLKTFDSPIEKINGAATWQDKTHTPYLFGGADGSGFLQNESCWKLDTVSLTWEQVTYTNCPIPRNHALVWEDNSRVWLMGGQKMDSVTALPHFYNDFWQWNKATHQWTEITTTLTPTPRADAVVWMDSTHQKLFLYGGFGISPNSQAPVGLDDLWSFDTNNLTWELVQASRGDYTPKRTIFDNNRIRQQTGDAPTTEDVGYRIGAKSWQERSSEVWVWGGQRNTQQEDPILWLYSTESNLWKSVIGYQYPNVEQVNKVMQPSANEVFILGKKHLITTNLTEIYSIQITHKK